MTIAAYCKTPGRVRITPVVCDDQTETGHQSRQHIVSELDGAGYLNDLKGQPVTASPSALRKGLGPPSVKGDSQIRWRQALSGDQGSRGCFDKSGRWIGIGRAVKCGGHISEATDTKHVNQVAGCKVTH